MCPHARLALTATAFACGLPEQWTVEFSGRATVHTHTHTQTPHIHLVIEQNTGPFWDLFLEEGGEEDSAMNVAVYCSVLQCVAAHCSAFHCFAVKYSVVQCCTVWSQCSVYCETEVLLNDSHVFSTKSPKFYQTSFVISQQPWITIIW